MSGYPWSVLGLNGPATEKEIRSAYARRLKVVRPDTDAAGFQTLVEARGFALELARSRVEDELLEALDDEDESDHTDTVAESAPADTTLRPDPTPITDTPASRDAVSAEPVRAPGDTGHPAPIHMRPVDGEPELTPPERIVAPPVTITLDALPASPEPPPSPMPLPPPPPATGEPSKWGALRDDGGAPPLPPASHDGPLLQSPDAVLVRLRALLASNRAALAPGSAEQVLVDLGRLPRSVRMALEPDILASLSAALASRVLERRGWSTRLAERLRLRPVPKDDVRAAGKARRALLIGLDEEFGWSGSDRGVYRSLPPQQAQRLMAELHAGLSEARIARDGLPLRWDADGLPLLDAADMQAFFGSEQTHYDTHYQEARTARRWRPTWRLSQLLLCPLWAIGVKNWRLAGLWLAAFFGMGQGLVWVERYVGPALSTYSTDVRGALTALGNLAAFAPLFALHLYVAGYSHRIELNRLARLARLADKRGLIASDERARYLRRRAPAFRFKDDSDKPGGWFKNWTPSTWFWVFVVYAIIKLLTVFGGK